jgi:protein TonB
MAVVAIGASPGVRAQNKQDVLAWPVSPASVALLVNEPESAGRQARLTAALGDERPVVRGVAARVVTVLHAVQQQDAVAAALAREADPAVAADLVRAMFAVGRAADPVVNQAIDRVGGPSAIVLAELVARTKGLAVLPFVPMLVERSRDPIGLGRALSALAVQDASARRPVAEAVVATGNADLWSAYDSALVAHRLDVGDDEWLPALRASSPVIRRRALWSVLSALSNKRGVSADVLAAAQPAPAAPPPSADDLEGLAREFVSRASGQARRVDLAPAVLAAGDAFRPYAAGWLTPEEVRSIREQGGGDHIKVASETPHGPEGKPTDMPTRTFWPLAKGLVAELMGVTGCRPGRRTSYGAAVVEYRADGTARGIGVHEGLDAACRRMISALSSLTLARSDHVVARQPREMLLYPLQREAVACLDGFEPGTSVPAVGGEVKSRRVTHEEEPAYTYAAMQRKAQGRVLADVIVSEDGCPVYASVKRGLDPDLDLQALHAILQWKFAPATLSGAPIPVWVTIEVAFRLK